MWIFFWSVFKLEINILTTIFLNKTDITKEFLAVTTFVKRYQRTNYFRVKNENK